MEHKTTILYAEACDCYERFGQCMHNNGGNYHRRILLHSVTDGDRYAVILEDTDTREYFNGDPFVYLIHSGDYFKLVSKQELEDDTSIDYIACFRPGEARIIAQS